MKIKLNIKPDVPNANGHIYTEDAIEKAMEEYKKLPHKLGSLKYTGEHLDLSKVAFEITDIEKIDDMYVATVNPLDTSEGKKLQEVIETVDDLRLCHMAIGVTLPEVNNFSISYYVILPKEKCA